MLSNSSLVRAATNVSAYWAERDSGVINHAHPAVNLANALVSVGLSSCASTAERLAETSLARDSDGSGGVAIWALVHCYGKCPQLCVSLFLLLELHLECTDTHNRNHGTIQEVREGLRK